ncbi:thioredoxin-dependent thiol peroxidase [Crocinitomix algicola]|uniref:thioredoxin-dependent thiol peroxidase n=1 Tax=Crocinitomix algicola TaxID=1740263 RepID=UPI0008726311|nr:thioredoxin-dependent thiol peroxidase [Crocinitomix algicola]
MTHLNIGDKAPNFSGKIENGDEISLKDFNGKRLIIYFYPKDMTPGCTTQSCNLRDNYSLLQEKGFEIIGISADDEKRHIKFIDKHELPFHLIADVDKKIINDYGVWGPKKFMGKEFDGIHRTTFVIDAQGNIEAIFKKVKTKAHAEQILEELEEN